MKIRQLKQQTLKMTELLKADQGGIYYVKKN